MFDVFDWALVLRLIIFGLVIAIIINGAYRLGYANGRKGKDQP